MYFGSTAAFGARMGLIVCAGEMLEIKVRVDLRRADVGVSQKFLHTT
jgi:hypothetical protein